MTPEDLKKMEIEVDLMMGRFSAILPNTPAIREAMKAMYLRGYMDSLKWSSDGLNELRKSLNI